MPSKTLLRPGETVAAAKHAWGARAAPSPVSIDIAEALEWRNEVVSNYDDSGQLPWLEERGIELIRGAGRITGKGEVDVDGQGVEAEQIVIATGSSAAFPPIDGLEGLDGVWTNREVTGMKEVPESILILGGGPVGVEMSQALRASARRSPSSRPSRSAAVPRGGAGRRGAGRGPRGGGDRAAPRRRGRGGGPRGATNSC